MGRYLWLLLAGCSFDDGVAATGTIPSEVDAATDVAQPACPAAYTLSAGGSLYRVITTAAAFAPHHTACNADQPGATHLASLETEEEMLALQTALLGVAAGQYYIGAVQQPNQPTPTDGWYVFTGGALPPGHFGSSNDDNAGENNEENLAALNTSDLLHDVTGDLAYPAVCECDGRAIDPTVASYLP